MSRRQPRMGRPPLPEGEARDIVFTLRLTEAERDVIVAAAGAQGQPATRWARDVLIMAARTCIAPAQPA